MQEPSASEGRRLNPAAIIVWTLESAGRFAIALVVPLLNLEGAFRLFAIAAVALLVLPSIVRYMRFRYAVTEDSLIVQGGLLFRWRRVIPFARIQSVEMIQKLRHRLFDVVELRIEAVGGRQTEAALVALDGVEAERLRTVFLRDIQAVDASAETDEPLVQLGIRELLLAGATGGRVAVIALLVGYAQELLPEDRLGDVIEGVSSAGSSGLAVVAIFVAVVLAISLILSLVATVLVYWNFTVRREGDRLVVTRGLIEHRRAAVPLRRVQAVVMEQNLLRRPFGLASLRVVLAGQARPDQEQQETSMLLPIGGLGMAGDLAVAILGGTAEMVGARLVPAAKGALLRRLTYIAIPVLAAVIALAFSRSLAALGLGLTTLVTVHAVLGWRSLGHRVEDGFVVVRSGVLVRRTTMVRVANIQHLQLSVSPTQRLYRLGTLWLRTAKGKPRAVDLDRAVAEAHFATLKDALLRAAP